MGWEGFCVKLNELSSIAYLRGSAPTRPEAARTNERARSRTVFVTVPFGFGWLEQYRKTKPPVHRSPITEFQFYFNTITSSIGAWAMENVTISSISGIVAESILPLCVPLHGETTPLLHHHAHTGTFASLEHGALVLQSIS